MAVTEPVPYALKPVVGVPVGDHGVRLGEAVADAVEVELAADNGRGVFDVRHLPNQPFIIGVSREDIIRRSRERHRRAFCRCSSNELALVF